MLEQHISHYGKIDEQRIKINRIIDEVYKEKVEKSVMGDYFEGFKMEKGVKLKNKLYSP